MTDAELRQVEFIDSPAYRAQILADFSKDLNGFRTYTYYFHSKEHDQVEKYNNWNFTTA